MSSEDTLLEQVDGLIAKGESVLATHPPDSEVLSWVNTLDSRAYAEWDGQSLTFLTQLLGHEHVYVHNFNAKGDHDNFYSVERGIGVLRAVRADLAQGRLGNPKVTDIDTTIEGICTRFHTVARQLRSRHDSRATLDVQDEYDVQDLLHAILCLYFDDVRPEEYTPSYAGKSSRMDFLLKRESAVIEAKMTRAGLGAREVSDQLIVDTKRYESHPDCKSLYCLVYDPQGLIPNPRGVEHDLSGDRGPFPVRVLIRPG
jgi:hypothetical protein